MEITTVRSVSGPPGLRARWRAGEEPPPEGVTVPLSRTTCATLTLKWECFFFEFLEDISPFCEATDAPVLNFCWRLPWVSKPGWTPCVLSRWEIPWCIGSLSLIQCDSAPVPCPSSQKDHSRKDQGPVPERICQEGLNVITIANNKKWNVRLQLLCSRLNCICVFSQLIQVV